MNAFTGKQVLALVRGGAYAHAGEEESIDLAFEGIYPSPERRVLDAGCGLGGTAAYIARRGWGRVSGVDRDEQAVAAARTLWPAGSFEVGDLLDIGRQGERFDLVCMFNVFYALSPADRAARALRDATVAGGRLLLFDYVDRGGLAASPIVVGGRQIIPHPLSFPASLNTFERADWRIDEIVDLTDRYLVWYERLCAQFEARRCEVEASAGPEGYAYAWSVYDGHVQALRDGRLGGALIRATAGQSPPHS